MTEYHGHLDRYAALAQPAIEHQPGGDEWVVLADPEGHLFCLAAGDRPTYYIASTDEVGEMASISKEIMVESSAHDVSVA